MTDLNIVVVQGRIVKDATFRFTKSGKKVADFTIASNRDVKVADGNYGEVASYFNISTFVSSDKFAKFLVKGQPVIAEGYLKQDRWETDDGQKRSQNNIGIKRVHLIFGQKKQTSEGETNGQTKDAEPGNEIIFENEDGQEDLYMPETGEFYC